jgi:serine/threonine-protein kinase
LKKFIDELRRREVLRTLGLYVGISWILIEASSVMLPTFGAPDWTLRLVIIAVSVGFPIAAVLAWIYDVASEGIVVQGDADPDFSPLDARKANLAVIGVLSVALVLSVYLNIAGGIPGAGEPEFPSIAVLPFVNMSSDEEQEYFSDGISEELINLLATIPEFRVAGRTSTFAFKGSDADPQAIGEQLAVNAILEGSVRKGGERVRITAQLVNVDDGFQLWSDTYDRELTDIFAVQDEIASAVADGLKVTLLGDTIGGSGRERPINPDAHNEYLRGLAYLNMSGPNTRQNAVSYFENALALEPDYALAWAGLGYASAVSAAYGVEDIEAALLKGREATAKALELDPGLPEGHYALGYIQHLFDWNWEAAESSYRRALELRPGDISIGMSLARLIGDRGGLDESLDMMRSLVAADPLNESLTSNYVRMLFDSGDFQAVDSAVTRRLASNPSLIYQRFWLALIAIYEGRFDEALTLAEAEPAPVGRWVASAAAHHRLGNTEAAIQARQELFELYGNHAAYQQAWISTSWGERDEAVRWLEIAYDARDPGLTGLKTDFLLLPLRDHPGYIALLKRTGL